MSTEPETETDSRQTQTGQEQDQEHEEDQDHEESESESLDPSKFFTGEDRYINFIEEFFGVKPSEIQRELLRAIANNQRVCAVGGNGPGKSFIAAMVNGAFLYSNPNSICMPTSGTYSVLNDTLWKPLQSKIKHAKEEFAEDEEYGIQFPGRLLQSPPRVDIKEEWYLKAVSPTHPSNLEGRHAGTMLITIEEADKPDISMAHIDSAESMITSDDDRMLVIANPPEDEGNCVYELMEDDSWKVIQFSSFASRNVKIDLGEKEGEKIPGLVDLETIKHDWVRWNREPWPGAEEARTAHERRDDLDTRWYRRRAGVIPPVGAEAHRPFYVGDVRASSDRVFDETMLQPGENPLAIAVDVARKGGDETVAAALYRNRLEFTAWQGMDHNENEARVLRLIERAGGRPPVAIDAVGEGSGLADRVLSAYDNAVRFKSGERPVLENEYYNCWTEGLVSLGNRLAESSGSLVVRDDDFREELYAAARVVELEENHRRSGDVLRATSKSEVKDRLGRSPDRLDAAMMASWVDYIQDLGPTVRSPRLTSPY